MTVFHALASARQAGIVVPNETIAKVVKYLKNVHDAETGGFTYNEKAAASFPCTAGGAYIAQLAGQRDTEMVNAALRHVKSQAPGIFTGARYYSYGHYYAIQAMVQAGDEEYAKWYPQIRDALISKQNAKGALGTVNKSGGISYETPMAIIILATPHRYIPIYQR
jgi:putative lipoic acid-binding regulatory protein